MSRSSHQRGFAPTYPFLSTPAINSSIIPRSYNHSSDESEAGSPSGGGGGNHGFVPPGHEAAFNYNTQSQLDDRPYIPRSVTQNTSTRDSRELALPPDSHQYEYIYGQAPVSTDAYPVRNTRHTQRHPGNLPSGGPQYDQDLRHTPSAGNHWGHPLVSEEYYRSHTSMGSSHNPSGGVPDSFQRNLPLQQQQQQQSFGGPQFHHRPGPPSGQGSQSPESPPGSLNPGLLDNPYEDAGDYLRRQLSIPPNCPINLYALPDPPNGSKPSQPLAILMKLAIYGSPHHKLTLREIYTALEDRYEWFRKNSHDASWKNSIRHHLSLNKVFRNIQRPITEPGKGKYWVLDVSEGEGYKRERKRRQKTKAGGSASEEEPTVDELEDFSEDDRSGSGSPGPSISRQERARRARGTPYPPQPSLQLALPGSTTAGLSQMSISDPSSLNSYTTMDSHPAQTTFGQGEFYGYSTTARTHTLPSFAQPSSAAMRPGPSRAQSAPMPGMISTSSAAYGFPGGSIQSGAQQVFRAPLRQSPTEQTHGYPGQIGGVPPGVYMDPRNAASPYEAQYNHAQYGSAGGMGRGSRDRGRGHDRN